MKKSSLLVALLGVVIGLLIALIVQTAGKRQRMMRVSGNDWRKIELVLQSIDENYVDSVDHKKVSDAVAAAALSALDPHSAYMPPQILEESEADLTGNFDGIGIQFNVPNERPLWEVPSKSPGPLIFMSSSASTKPSVVLHISSRRLRLSLLSL